MSGKFPRQSAHGTRRLLAVSISVMAAVVVAGAAGAGGGLDEPPISYSATPSNDPVAQLQARINAGATRLTWSGERGYLDSLLSTLQIPISSQALVFSKTSFQRERISPAAPRAIYFNDSSYLGYVRSGPFLEIATTDPQLGAVFYTLRQVDSGKPRFVRQGYECLTCHASTFSRSVPGHIVRSVFADRTGQTVLDAGSYLTTDSSPLSERYGGWYVTGTHGQASHMGNRITHSLAQADRPGSARDGNLLDLRGRVDTSHYPSGHSDLVALMVLTHQASVHNLITQLNYETRRALFAEAQPGMGTDSKPPTLSDEATRAIDRAAEALLRGLLFSGEPRLPAPVAGTSSFSREFALNGPRDRKGRSLRELDLKSRLLKYPCSYLIYSDAFEGLPREARRVVYSHLRRVLSDEEPTPHFRHLSLEDRTALREILADTKPEFTAAPL